MVDIGFSIYLHNYSHTFNATLVALVLLIGCLALSILGCSRGDKDDGTGTGGGDVAVETKTKSKEQKLMEDYKKMVEKEEAESKARGEIFNLPEELKAVSPVTGDENHGSDGPTSYDFSLEETTTFVLKVENAKGKISIGVKKDKVKDPIIEAKDYPEGTTEEEFTLEPGSYSLKVNEHFFQGYYHIKKK